MNIFRLSGNNFDTRYARAVVADEPQQLNECPICHRVVEPVYDKLRLAWAIGRGGNPLNEIADFTWPCGLGFVVVRDDTRERVSRIVPDLVFHEVEIVGFTDESAESDQLTPITTPPSISGLPLWWLTSKHNVHLDIAKSGRRSKNCCDICGKCDWIVEDNAQIIVDENQLGHATCFRVHEVGSPYFITEQVAESFLRERFSNLRVKVAGSVSRI